MRKRLDEVLVVRGLAPSRSRARDVIDRGLVLVGSTVVAKASALVNDDATIEIDAAAGTNYVSRGALKVVAALTAFGFDAQDCAALDIGASTGGFTQVLLQRGARRVYAVDVGHNQLHPDVKANAAVVSLEGMDARALTREQVPDPVDAIVADVSFISLTKVLPSVCKLAGPKAWLVALIKPQFEVGRAGIGKGGIVRDAALRQGAVERVKTFIATDLGWRVAGVIPSPIEGGSGNIEYLIGAQRGG
jgi:23S rRNA (cytidine1920-2'-O)/16S rRNA (cytidine1409-2'-O)-methyltransferase